MCNVCVQAGVEEPFRVPWDPADHIAIALMQAHLDKHEEGE